MSGYSFNQGFQFPLSTYDPMQGMSAGMPNMNSNAAGFGQPSGFMSNINLDPGATVVPRPNVGLGGTGSEVTPGIFSFDRMFGGKDSTGWVGPAAAGVGALASGYLGMKQYGMAKKQLAEARRQFDTNLNMQRSDINRRLEDRQRTRLESSPGHHMGVDEYMKKYGV